MKNRLLILLVALMSLTMVTPAKGQGWSVWVGDGVTLSTLAGLDSTVPKLGTYTSLGLNYRTLSAWGVELEVAYAEQGSVIVDGSTRVTYAYNYLNIPLMATVELADRLTLLGGVQAGWLVAANYQYRTPSVLDEGAWVEGGDALPREEFHPWDFGVTLGLRQMLVPSIDLVLDVRYTLGITQTHNGVATSIVGNPYISVPDNRNSVLRVGLSIAF